MASKDSTEGKMLTIDIVSENRLQSILKKETMNFDINLGFYY